MGIKHFFRWFRTQFTTSISRVKSVPSDTAIHTLLVDMNGIIHTSAQKVYRYGNYKPLKRLLGREPKMTLNQQLEVFKTVCETIKHLIATVRPSNRVVLCIDGTAPVSKQNQQRQRRFRSSFENGGVTQFDQNCITPGTKFMDYLSKYIDWYLRKNLTDLGNIDIVFSSDKTPGEGEHKLINYLRKYGNMEDTFCICGMDADLIMLALGTHLPKMYILREDMVDENYFFLINISQVHKDLATLMRWNKDGFQEEYAINDFILMCFTVGNDFLPHIPALAIIEGGIDIMLDVYKNVGDHYGHLTKKKKGKPVICRKSFQVFIGTLSQYEKGALEQKLKNKDKYFPDPLMESHFTEGVLNMEKYKEEYYSQHFGKTAPKEVCHQYIQGMSWVLTYYLTGVPDWNWFYPHQYAPFLSTLSQHIKNCSLPDYTKVQGVPRNQFVQLLCVLPPKSANLIPKPLCNILDKIPFPSELTVDLSGCRQEWEGIVILPHIDDEFIHKEYEKLKQGVSEQDRRRDVLESNRQYKITPTNYVFNSFYGDIETPIRVNTVDF